MNTEARDPILRGLDELARLTDDDLGVDRMAGITRKARNNRRRRVGAAVAALAVIAAGTVGAAQLLGDGDSSSGPGFAEDPPPPAASGLTIDLTVDQIDTTQLSVTYRIHGTATAWSAADTRQSTNESGPRYTSIQLDGKDVSGTDGGDIECRAGAPEVAYDETFDVTLEPVTIPGPGTYTVTIQAPYCGADGKVVPNEVSETVTVPDS